jgi:hypothetical protein
MAKELTRRELYVLVWARPMTKVAADFGISNVGLRKICVKHRIPVPGRGYWVKLAAGQPVKKAVFREVQDAALDRIRIGGGLAQSLPTSVIETRDRARAETKKRREDAPPEATLSGLHPVVEHLKQKLEKSKPAGDGMVHVSGAKYFPVVVTPTVIPRALAILDRLVRESEARGNRIESGDKALRLNVDDEPISIEVTEKTDRVPHVLTQAETAALQRWETERERKQRRGDWYSDWDKPHIAEWDFVPNGQITIEIDQETRWDGLRRRFSDGRRQRLEVIIDDVLTAAVTCAAAKKRAAGAPERWW